MKLKTVVSTVIVFSFAANVLLVGMNNDFARENAELRFQNAFLSEEIRAKKEASPAMEEQEVVEMEVAPPKPLYPFTTLVDLIVDSSEISPWTAAEGASPSYRKFTIKCDFTGANTSHVKCEAQSQEKVLYMVDLVNTEDERWLLKNYGSHRAPPVCRGVTIRGQWDNYFNNFRNGSVTIVR
jgi:hypothetical protein